MLDFLQDLLQMDKREKDCFCHCAEVLQEVYGKGMSMLGTKKQRMVFAILLVFFLFATGFTVISLPDNILDVGVVRPAQGTVTYLDRTLPLGEPMLFVSGRLFLPLQPMVTALGGAVSYAEDALVIKHGSRQVSLSKEKEDALYMPLYFESDTPYIYLYDLTNLFSLAAVFDSDANKLSLYHRQAALPYEADREDVPPKPAYLRLEDITADYGIGNNYTDEGLEKLRVIADYMYERGQSFDIAWIPLYTNPSRQLQNDLTSNFDFYNAGFLYTLDYLVDHNGQIVLHGLTHQENDTVSAVGTEFGKNSPFTLDEVEERMKHAKKTARWLSFDDSIFEFPHYSFTPKQLDIAVRLFGTICMQYPYARKAGRVEHVNSLRSDTTFIPAPLGYMPNQGELPEFREKIKNAVDSELLGMFVHPYIDFANITCATVDGYRTFDYQSGAIIPSVVDEVAKNGYVFSKIK